MRTIHTIWQAAEKLQRIRKTIAVYNDGTGETHQGAIPVDAEDLQALGLVLDAVNILLSPIHQARPCVKHELEFQSKKTPSWRAGGEGAQFVRITTHPHHKQLHLDCQEVSLEGNGSSKRTFTHLDADKTEQLMRVIFQTIHSKP